MLVHAQQAVHPERFSRSNISPLLNSLSDPGITVFQALFERIDLPQCREIAGLGSIIPLARRAGHQ